MNNFLGNICGGHGLANETTGYVPADFVGYDYIYFWMPMPGYFNKTTCVKECPVFNSSDPVAMDA